MAWRLGTRGSARVSAFRRPSLAQSRRVEARTIATRNAMSSRAMEHGVTDLRARLERGRRAVLATRQQARRDARIALRARWKPSCRRGGDARLARRCCRSPSFDADVAHP